VRDSPLTLLAAGCWLVLAFCVWNVRFDYGVRVAASQFLAARPPRLHSPVPPIGPHDRAPIEMADAMRTGIDVSAQAATRLASPVAAIGVVLLAIAVRPPRR
jgi:hypothetical protein